MVAFPSFLSASSEIILLIASSLAKPVIDPELITLPSPSVAIPEVFGSSKPVSITTLTGSFIAFAKSKSR